MKHIFNYKSFNESNSDYYIEIGVNEFNGAQENGHVDFTTKETSQIANLAAPSNRNLYREDIIVLKYISTQISIKKFSDEWYYLMVVDPPSQLKLSSADYTADDFKILYYKCDQFDGVLKFIVDKINPNINI